MSETENKKKYHINKVLVIIILLLIGILTLLSYRIKSNSPQTETPQSYKTYIDPASHFSITIPSDWVSVSDFGRQKTAMNTPREEITRTEVTNLSSGKVGLNLLVFEKAPNCSTVQTPNTALAGFPAYYDSKQYSWTINTTDSTIIIGYYFPGAGIYHRRKTATAPLSQSDFIADKNAVEKIVFTLKILDSQPLQCP